MIYNVIDIVSFLTDKSKKPQGGCIKGCINSIYVKTSNSASLPLYIKEEQITGNNDDNLDDWELQLYSNFRDIFSIISHSEYYKRIRCLNFIEYLYVYVHMAVT